MSKVFDISPRVKDTVVCIVSGLFAYLFYCAGNVELSSVCIGIFGSYALKNGYKSVKS